MNPINIIEDANTLAELSARTALEDAKSQEVSYAEAAKEAERDEAAERSTRETFYASRQNLYGLKTTKVAELQSKQTQAWEAVLATEDDPSQHLAALRCDEEEVNSISRCLVYADTVRLPAVKLGQLRAEASLLRAVANWLTSRALVAGVERHAALQQLIATDNVATVGHQGRAHEMLLRSLAAHRDASLADVRLREEEERQSLPGKLSK